MTPAQLTQIQDAKGMLEHGYSPDDLRAIGFAQGAINAAIKEIEQGRASNG